MDLSGLDAFPRSWTVEVLAGPPLIAPARQYTYPVQIAGQEDALERGALMLLVRPEIGRASFLATCALGFRDPTMPSGVFSTPRDGELCAVAGGYAYLIDTAEPTLSVHVPLKPVTAVLPVGGRGLLLFVGFHTIQAFGRTGWAWSTGRLSWEGVRIIGFTETHVYGYGWNMLTDKEVAFEVDLTTGEHVGGGFGA